MSITKASLALHSYLITTESQRYIPENSEIVQTEEINKGPLPITRQGLNNGLIEATKVCNQFKTCFNSNEGAVSWQSDYVQCIYFQITLLEKEFHVTNLVFYPL